MILAEDALGGGDETTEQGLGFINPAASKNVDLVVDVVHKAGLSTKVVRMRPMGVIKG